MDKSLVISPANEMNSQHAPTKKHLKTKVFFCYILNVGVLKYQKVIQYIVDMAVKMKQNTPVSCTSEYIKYPGIVFELNGKLLKKQDKVGCECKKELSRGLL